MYLIVLLTLKELALYPEVVTREWERSTEHRRQEPQHAREHTTPATHMHGVNPSLSLAIARLIGIALY